MYYYLYEIKNKLNGMIYIGIHKTKNLNDGYMGSGKILTSAINKYGKDNFEKTVLKFFENEEAMRAAEASYVDESFLARDDVYNLVAGGGCGWSYVNEKYKTKPKSQETCDKISKTLRENYPETTREAVRAAAKKPKSEEQKRKTSLRMTGKKHREYGPMSSDQKALFSNLIWINNKIENKRINKNLPVPDGWEKGRIKRVQ